MSDKSHHPRLAPSRQTLYLGQVERGRMKGRIKLIAARAVEGFWVPLPLVDFIELPHDHRDLHHKMLVFLELNDKQVITQLLTSDVEIIRFVNHLASSVDKLAEKESKLAERESHIREWRESLQFQSEEFTRRTEALAVREAEIEERFQA